MLTQTAGQPLYGKFSDLIGRKVGKRLKRPEISLTTPATGGPLREHVDILCWFTFMWRFQGEITRTAPRLIISRLLLPRLSHG